MENSEILTIISEYNPMHLGHLYHLNESINISHPKYKVAIISGNFVQRGEPSILNKWIKTKLALKAGFDLVIELPCIYSLSSAENFANGAVKIANTINSDVLSFGTECGDLDKLNELSTLTHNNINYIEKVKEYISKGFSYPKAQELSIKDLFDGDFSSICMPNNILGLEYLRSIKFLDSNIKPITVKRNVKFSSSSSVRAIIKDSLDFSDITSVPSYVLDELQKNTNNLVLSLKCFEKEIFYKLRSISFNELLNVPDIPENMVSRIITYANQTNSLDELIKNLKNKSITQARIQRILLYILLGITKNDMNVSKNITPYVRVLGASNSGKNLISKISNKCQLITSVKDFEEKCTNKDLLRLLDIDKRASDIYTLAYKNNSTACLDYTTKFISL